MKLLLSIALLVLASPIWAAPPDTKMFLTTDGGDCSTACLRINSGNAPITIFEGDNAYLSNTASANSQPVDVGTAQDGSVTWRVIGIRSTNVALQVIPNKSMCGDASLFGASNECSSISGETFGDCPIRLAADTHYCIGDDNNINRWRIYKWISNGNHAHMLVTGTLRKASGGTGQHSGKSVRLLLSGSVLPVSGPQITNVLSALGDASLMVKGMNLDDPSIVRITVNGANVLYQPVNGNLLYVLNPGKPPYAVKVYTSNGMVVELAAKWPWWNRGTLTGW
jgi:hypothetical protein